MFRLHNCQSVYDLRAHIAFDNLAMISGEKAADTTESLLANFERSLRLRAWKMLVFRRSYISMVLGRPGVYFGLPPVKRVRETCTFEIKIPRSAV